MPPAPPAPPASTLQAQTHLSTPQHVYLWLSALSVAALIISDITGVKLFSIPLPFKLPVLGENLVHSCGMLAFPITFLLTDLVNEYYGRKAARRIVYISFTMGAVVWVVVRATLAMPRLDAPYNVQPGAFEAIFNASQLMYVASLMAYITGSLADIAVFGWLKRMTGGRFVWLRATGSTVVSQMLDSLVVTFFGLYLFRVWFPGLGAGDPVPLGSVLTLAATGYILKFFIAIALTPLIYAGRALMQRKFGLIPLPHDHA